MAHLHKVYDTDAHFLIDPITREITNESSGKTVLIRGDHNSERFTFEVPDIDGHDMMQCNLVAVHYINIDAADKTLQSKGVYEVDDMKVSSTGTEFSWLISELATMYTGTLNFCIRFECTDSDGTVEYRWQTAIFSKISIADSYDNTGDVVEAFPDILAQWKAELFEAGGDAVVNINTARDEALESIQNEAEEVINAANTAEQNAKNVLANAIIGSLSGEVVTADDVSPVEHEMVVKVICPDDIDPATVTVRRCGKNLAYGGTSQTYTSNGVTIKRTEDSSELLINGTAEGTFSYVLTKSVTLNPGTYTVSVYGLNTVSSFLDRCYAYNAVGSTVFVNAIMTDKPQSFTLEEVTQVRIEAVFAEGTSYSNEKIYLQMEKGDTATDYEGCVETQIIAANADGTVSGMTSLSPNMTILTDTEGAVVECEYNKDTNKVIEKLVNAIIALGGTV